MAEQTAPIVETALVNAFMTARDHGGRLCGNGRNVSPSTRGDDAVN